MGKKKNQYLIYGSCLLMIIGVLIVSFDYLKEKKAQAYEMMNIKLLEYQNGEDLQTTDDDQEELSQLPDIEEIEEEKEPQDSAIPSGYIGYLEIPKIELKKGLVPVDSPYNNIEYNVTIHAKSDYPNVTNGNFILMAHSGTAVISYFRNLYQLGVGDEAIVTYQGVRYRYTIVNIYNVPKNGTVSVRRNKNKTALTMITCTYQDDTSQTVYIAELVSQEAV